MKTSKKTTFKCLNFNLKNEIFSFYQPKEILMKFLLICKDFSYAVRNLRWFKLIKEDFKNLLLQTSCEFSKMEKIINNFRKNGESEMVAHGACLYLSLRKIKYKKFLKISNYEIWDNDKNANFLNNILKENNSIEQLDLFDIKLGNYLNNMRILKESFKINMFIQDLNLANNNLGGNEINLIYLKESLEINKTIKQLNLSLNNLGENQINMLYLKEILKKNNTIENLNLRFNQLGSNEISMGYLKEAFQYNNSITHLNIANNNLEINEKNKYYIKEALEMNHSIQHLDLSFNNYSESEKRLLKDTIKIII